MKDKVIDYIISRLQRIITTRKQISIIQLSNCPTDYLIVEHCNSYLNVKCFMNRYCAAMDLNIPLHKNRPTFKDMAERIIQEVKHYTTWQESDFLNYRGVK